MRMIKRNNRLFVTFGGSSRRRNEHGKGFGNGRKDRPPKLSRFCASGGLLDQDVAARMSSGEMCFEAAKVTGYAARGLASSVRGMAKGVFQFAGVLIVALK